MLKKEVWINGKTNEHLAWMGRGHAGRLEDPPSVVSSEAKVTILKRDRRRLLRKQARANVAFKPGVDVSGNKVTGTTFTEKKIKCLKEFSFNLNINIA